MGNARCPTATSRVPRIGDGTLVPVDTLRFPAVPGMAIADRINPLAVFSDWTDPVELASPHRALVPAVGVDGNERAGIRLPDVAVPLDTLTGCSLDKEPFPSGALAIGIAPRYHSPPLSRNAACAATRDHRCRRSTGIIRPTSAACAIGQTRWSATG